LTTNATHQILGDVYLCFRTATTASQGDSNVSTRKSSSLGKANKSA
jgi:hypothetical protein